jgi:RHS repeat-associated protein
VTSNYGYDAIYELTSVLQGANTTESYTYDPVGNRLSSLSVSPYSYNASNELTSTPNAAYGYDLDGNAVTKNDSTGITTYAWDFENRLTSVTLPAGGGTVTFAYDPFGRRIEKASSAGTSIYAGVYPERSRRDGDNLVEETNSSGAVVARYSQGLNIDEPLAMLRSGATDFYEADGLGSVTSLSNTAGALAQTYTFDSFGKQTASSGSLTNPFQYTGREFDPETSLYYYRARYYDPASGRFLSEDPAVFRGQDVNLYRYVRNQPARYTDPIGLVSIDPTFNSDCLPALKRAINIVRNLPKKCDCAFKNIGSHRSLKQLMDDPNIAIHFDPTGPTQGEDAYTLPGDTHDIWIHPLPCRMGRWSLAQILVHELVHITLVPGPGQDDPNGPAYGMERTCGLSPLSISMSISVPAPPSAPIQTQDSPLPDKLTPP